ncbi:helix-turn-helix domain-containing protein [uncultured Robinsoniella sp.]|uniref:helix-turn-helix domain-containing protein n=1 Tax=uncultured Robinsoniella sp. TaxID=904190 RepID=UPI00374E91F3
MIKYKIEVIPELKKHGYSAYRIRKEKIIGESQMQKIRDGELASKEVLNKICEMLNCQPGDLLEYVPDDKKKEAPRE